MQIFLGKSYLFKKKTFFFQLPTFIIKSKYNFQAKKINNNKIFFLKQVPSNKGGVPVTRRKYSFLNVFCKSARAIVYARYQDALESDTWRK